MDYDTQSSAENTARLLLDEYRLTHPQWRDDRTPIDEIVHWSGLQIETFHPDDYEVGVHGFVDPDEDERLIWLRRDLPEAFRRFTLAHELGHVILHCHGNAWFQQLVQQAPINPSQPLRASGPILPEPSRTDPCTDDDIQEDMTSILDQEQFVEALGIGQTYDPRNQREIAANIFAAELLLPRERLLACYCDQQLDPHTLAARFGVSQTAMLNRLAGMLKPTRLTREDGSSDGESTPKIKPASTKKRYDEFQQAAIEAITPALIVAGPGSGKTSTLIGRVTYLISNQGIAPQNILALTFSRKAAQEMEERLRQVLDDTVQYNYALPKVSTFHAFCADLLRRYGTLVGLRADFTLIDEAEGYFLLRRRSNAMHLYHYQNLPNPTHYFPDMLKAISRAKDELITPVAYTQLAQKMQEEASNDEELTQAEKALEIAHVYQLYEEELAQRGDSDFGGLLMLTLRLFTEQPEIRQEVQQQYQQILVDEFQDVKLGQRRPATRASGTRAACLGGW